MSDKSYKDFKIGDVVEVVGLMYRDCEWLSRGSKKLTWERRNKAKPIHAYYVGWTVKYNGKVTLDFDYGNIFERNKNGAVILARIRRFSRAKEEYVLFSDIKKVEGVDPDDEWGESNKWPDIEYYRKLRQELREDAYKYKCKNCGKFANIIFRKGYIEKKCKCGHEEIIEKS